MARAPEKVIKRVRQLFRLASSPNPHEAARAREEAERTLRKHGLTYADVEEDTVAIVDIPEGRLDANLARVVGISRRCQASINRIGQLAYRGKKANIERARALYIYLTEQVSAHCEIGSRDPGRHVYRRYYWGGFIQSITERLKDAEVAVWVAPPVENMEHGSPHKIVIEYEEPPSKTDPGREELKEFAQRFLPDDQYAVRRFCEDAFAAGKAFGRSLYIPDDSDIETRTNRMLGHKETA